MKLISKLFGLYKNRKKKLNSLIRENGSDKTEKKFDLVIEDFSSINNFWKFITEQKKWYLKYLPNRIKNIDNYLTELEPLITETTNELRKKMEFTYDDYEKIINWDNLLIRADMDDSKKFKSNKTIKFKQFCSNCKKETGFSQRYPKCICRECYSETTDLKGKKVEFFNTEALGYGCQGYYVGTEQEERYDSNLCYINGKEYFGEEAIFGGIVIQLKE